MGAATATSKAEEDPSTKEEREARTREVRLRNDSRRIDCLGARRRAQAVEAKEASAKGTSGSSSEEILSIHDVPTKASTDVGLRPLDYKIMGEEE